MYNGLVTAYIQIGYYMITTEEAEKIAAIEIQGFDGLLSSIMTEDKLFFIFSPNHRIDDQTVLVSKEFGETLMYKAPYEFHKWKPSDKVWKVTDENMKGPLYFTFDRQYIFNLWCDYPWKLTKKQKETFDKDYPY